MIIGFWDNQLGERGTTACMFDYAYHNEKILGNHSFIFYIIDSPNNNKEIIKKFERFFPQRVFGVINIDVADKIIINLHISHLYNTKSGEIDSIISKKAINCIHAVFNCFQPHGDIYSSISPWVLGNNNQYPVVPYMIDLPNHDRNMRQKLNIPLNAKVFGGYGGKDRFNIPYVHLVVYQVALNEPDIYFLFANFNQFCKPLSNIIHLPTITEKEDKVEFINTCDAMLWARSGGETFGLAIAEFSTKNKPVIACDPPNSYQAHIYLLGDKGLWYSNPIDLTIILIKFNPDKEKKKDWNAYRDYTPEKIMQVFQHVFLKNEMQYFFDH